METSQMNNRNFLIGTALLGLIIAVISLSVVRDRADPSALQANTDHRRMKDASAQDANAAMHDSQAMSAAPKSQNEPPQLLHGIPLTRDGLSLEADPFVAVSIAEQKWLDAHGFPNEKLWAYMLSASRAELEVLAASGIPSAQALLESKKLIEGDDEAVTRMIVQGAKGNLFSLNLLSSYLAAKPESRISAYAISKAQERCGDTRIPLTRDTVFPRPLDVIERAEGEAEAIKLYELIDAIRKKENSPAVAHRPTQG